LIPYGGGDAIIKARKCARTVVKTVAARAIRIYLKRQPVNMKP